SRRGTGRALLVAPRGVRMAGGGATRMGVADGTKFGDPLSGLAPDFDRGVAGDDGGPAPVAVHEEPRHLLVVRDGLQLLASHRPEGERSFLVVLDDEAPGIMAHGRNGAGHFEDAPRALIRQPER